jgi:hypothetical protein
MVPEVSVLHGRKGEQSRTAHVMVDREMECLASWLSPLFSIYSIGAHIQGGSSSALLILSGNALTDMLRRCLTDLLSTSQSNPVNNQE